jgi:hypothetical protein
MPKRILLDDQAFALLYHTRLATPFSSPDGEPCASIPTSTEARHVLPIRSAAFRDWVIASYYAEYETAPSPVALRAALRTLEARARYGDLPNQKVDRRLSFEGDPFTPTKIILDLANPAGENLEVTSHGWHVERSLTHAFRQSPATLPLPAPSPQTPAPSSQSPVPSPQPLSGLSDLFHLTTTARTRTLTWLTAALRPIGPYPILVIQGPASSGKSLLARALRALIDPCTAPVRRLPIRDRDLLQLARRNWVLAFDPVHRVPARISEALCAISSGDAIEITQLDYRDPLVFQLARPVILVTPTGDTHSDSTPPHTLSNRTLTIELAPIAALRTEAALMSDFEALRPSLLASLADAVSSALHNIRDTDLGNVARFPDAAAWTAAASPALGLTPAAIIQAISDPESIWTGSKISAQPHTSSRTADKH